MALFVECMHCSDYFLFTFVKVNTSKAIYISTLQNTTSFQLKQLTCGFVTPLQVRIYPIENYALNRSESSGKSKLISEQVVISNRSFNYCALLQHYQKDKKTPLQLSDL